MRAGTRKVLVLLAFTLLSSLAAFAQTANNSSIKIKIEKNGKYTVSGTVENEAVKSEVVGKIKSQLGVNNVDFTQLKVNSSAANFASDWQQKFDKSLLKVKNWKSGVFIFTANLSAPESYPNLPAAILNADINLLGGKTVRIADYQNKTVVLFLLASWCGPCIKQAEDLNDFYSSNLANEFEIIGVDTDEDDEKYFPEFVRRIGVKYKMGFAAEDRKFYESLLKISKFPAIPQVFLIRDGRLYGVFTGGSPTVSKKLKETILEVSQTK